MFDSRTRLQIIHILLISLKIRHLLDRLNSKDTYRGTYLVLDLTFGEPFQKGKKGGTYYINATIPIEHRAICFGKGSKTKQKTVSLGTKNYAESVRVLPKAKAKIFEWYRNKVKQYDPLLVSAENLVESLYARMDINKKLKPQEVLF